MRLTYPPFMYKMEESSEETYEDRLFTYSDRLSAPVGPARWGSGDCCRSR
jgi:hypothetical protein